MDTFQHPLKFNEFYHACTIIIQSHVPYTCIVMIIVTQYNVGYIKYFMIAMLELMEVLSVC